MSGSTNKKQKIKTVDEVKLTEELTKSELNHLMVAALKHRSVRDALLAGPKSETEKHLRYRYEDMYGVLYYAIHKCESTPDDEGHVDDVLAIYYERAEEVEDYTDENGTELGENINDMIAGGGISASVALKQAERLLVRMVSIEAVKPGDPMTVAYLREAIEKIEAVTHRHKPLRSMAERVPEIEAQVENDRGKELVGLKTGVAKWDEMLSGLYGFGVLGGRAGSGKTSKCVELVSGVLTFNDENDACVVYLSADMSTREIQRHFLCYLANMSSVRYQKGTPAVLPHLEGSKSPHHQTKYVKGTKFDKLDHAKLTKAINTFSGYGKDLFVVGNDEGHRITADMMMRSAEQARKQTGRAKCLLVVDYLQLVATPDGMGELQADEHKVAEIMRVVSGGAAHVLAISETRKPDRQQEWGTDVADLKGAARLGYAPDWVAMIKEMTLKEAAAHYVAEDGELESKLVALERHTDETMQRAPRLMAVVKARGSRSRGKWAEEFFFRTGRFSPLTS